MFNIFNIFIPLFIKGVNSYEITISPCNCDNDLGFLQSYIDDVEISINNTDEIGTIYLTEGTYIIDNPLYIKSNINMIGLDMDNTIIKLMDDSPSFKGDNYAHAGIIRIYYHENIILSNFTIDGNKDNQNLISDDDEDYEYGRFGIYTEVSHNILIDSLIVKNCQGYGVDPHGASDQYNYSYNFTISNSYIYYNDWDGITLDKNYYSYAFNNIIYNNGRHGINVVTGSVYVELYNNYLYDNGWDYDYDNDGSIDSYGCGIMVQNNQGFGTSHIDIYNNVVHNSSKNGICINSIIDIFIYDNEITETNYCFHLGTSSDADEYGTSDAIIDSNNCSYVTYGIYFNEQSENNTFENNNIIYSSNEYTDYGNNNTITNNNWEHFDGNKNGESSITVSPLENEDNLDNINNAINNLKRLEGEVGTLYLEEGTYLINGNLELKSHMVLQGAGIDKTIIKLIDNADSFMKYPESDRETHGSESGIVRMEDQDDIYIKDLTIDGNKENQNLIPEDDWVYNAYSYGRYGLYTEVCNNIHVSSIRIKNCQGYGVDPHGEAGSYEYTKNFTIIDSFVHNNDWDGITLDKIDTGYAINNTVYENGRHGFNLVTGTFDFVIHDNFIYNNGFYYDYNFDGELDTDGCGITIQNNGDFGTKNIVIYDNIINNSSKNGLCINSIDTVEIYNNEINDATYCISLGTSSDSLTFGTTDLTMYDNVCKNVLYGIKLDEQSKNNNINNNEFSYSKSKYVNDGTYNIINDNEWEYTGTTSEESVDDPLYSKEALIFIIKVIIFFVILFCLCTVIPFIYHYYY